MSKGNFLTLKFIFDGWICESEKYRNITLLTSDNWRGLRNFHKSRSLHVPIESSLADNQNFILTVGVPLIGFLFRKTNRNYGQVLIVSMSLNRRCTLASIRRTMILPAFPRTAGSRFHPLRRGASIDAGVGVWVCVWTGCSPRAYLLTASWESPRGLW